MTDQEYARIVEEFKSQKQGGGTDPEADTWASLNESMCGLKAESIRTQIFLIGSKASRANGFPKRGGPFDSTIQRAEALFERAGRIAPRRIPHETYMRIHDISSRVKAGDPLPQDPAVFDRMLGEIEGLLASAERAS